jgi:hypothetical protein
MSQERARRPARKRQPDERLPPAGPPVIDEPEKPARSPDRVITHDPGGWLAIGLLVMVVAAVAFYTALTLLAAN